MRRLALFGALFVAAIHAPQAQQSGATISGEVSIGYADVPPWLRNAGYKSSTFATVYDAVSDRSYQVTIDSSLARPYGGIEALHGKKISLRVGPQNHATAITSVTDTRPRVTRAGQSSVHAHDRAGFGIPNPFATGDRRIIGLGCSFKGNTDRSWPGGEISPVFFGANGIESYWKENSADQVNFGNSQFIDGFKELPLTSDRYIPNPSSIYMDSLATDCVAQYTGQVNFDNYDIIVIHTSYVAYCCQVTSSHLTFKINGVRTTKSVVVFPGQPTVAYTQSISITGHEMGHALGLPHSAPENGNTYASEWDIMSAAVALNNAAGQLVPATQTLAGHKDRLGWIPANRRFVTYGGTSTITLERNALPAANSNYLIAEIPFGDDGAFYTAELRQKAGSDFGLPREGVIINRSDPVAGTGDLLIVDRDGNANPNDDGAVLVAGQTYFDPRSQVAVTVNSITGTSASITIVSGGGTLVDVTRLASNTTLAAGSISNDSVTVHIDGANASSIAWTASTDRASIAQDVLAGQNSWLQVTTPSGNGPGQVRFRRNAAGIAPGTYVDSITVRMPSLNKAWQHVDTLTVTAPSSLYLGLSKILKRDSTNAALLQDSITVSVTGPGAATAAWTALATNGGRVSRLVETSGTGTQKLHFSAGPNVNSAPGWYVDTIIVTLTATPNVRAMMVDSIHMVGPVIYSIPIRSHRDSLPAGYSNKLDSVVVGFNAPWSTTAQWNIELSQQAYDTTKHRKHINIISHTDPGLFIVTPEYFVTGNGVAYYTRDAGRLQAGIYVDTIHVRGPFPNPSPVLPLHQGEQLIFDTLVVYETPKQLVLSRSSTRDTIPLGMARSTDSVIVQATGRDTVHYTPISKRHADFYLPGQPPTEREAGAFDYVNYQQIRWNRNLSAITAPGVYVDTIVFQSVDGTLKSIPFLDSLVVLPASVLTVSSARRAGSADASASAIADSVTVGSLANKSASWTARKRKSWTSLTTSSGAVGDKVRWTRNPAGLAPGIYIDTISVGAAGFLSAALVDSFTVTGTQTATSQIAQATFDADSLGGVFGYDVGTTLSINVAPIAQSLGSYTVQLQWDSTVIRMDSALAVAGGFPAPALNARRGDQVTLSATAASGLSGSVPLARMWFHFITSSVGRSTQIAPTFTAVKSSVGNADLLSNVTVKPIKALIIPGALRGDVNLDGKLTSADALMMVKFLVGITPTPGSVFTFNPNGDANCNGKVEAVDLQYVLAKLVGLPVGTACVGTIK